MGFVSVFLIKLHFKKEREQKTSTDTVMHEGLGPASDGRAVVPCGCFADMDPLTLGACCTLTRLLQSRGSVSSLGQDV